MLSSHKVAQEVETLRRPIGAALATSTTALECVMKSIVTRREMLASGSRDVKVSLLHH